MALRLTGTTPQSDTSASRPGQTADMVALQARNALTRGDVPAFNALLADAEALADRHRRFATQLGLLQAALGVTAEASEGLALRIFIAVAEAALNLLESEPAEPVLLNLGGVALYELWSLDAAQALFKAARRLDPELADAKRNLRELARRRRIAGQRTRPLHAAVPGLARRARSIAGRARPATGLTLSLCMIVRDEEQMLPRCLAAVAPAVDEIVIVDTGSTDATVEIARSFGARVIEQPWTGSFAEARNASFDAATGDWLLYLDADEILVEEDVNRLRALTGQIWREAFFVVETSYLGELGSGAAMVSIAPRIFRNRPAYRFEGRLHEQIFHTLPAHLPGRIGQTSVRVEHYGYLGSVREAKEKSRRNIEILKQQAATSPSTAFLHFNMGSEYCAAGDPEAGARELTRARQMLVDEGVLQACIFSPMLFSRLVMALRSCGRFHDAAAAAAEGLELLPDFTDLVLEQAKISEALGDEQAAEDLYRRCLDLGDAPARYGAMVGCGTFLPHLHLAELSLRRHDTASARAALARCVAEHPDFVAVAAPYAKVLLLDGVSPDQVVSEIERLGNLPARVRQSVAASLRQAGEPGAAEEQYRLALDATPANAWLRTTLGELLLSRGAWDGAAELAERVPDDDPHAALARRIELVALIGRAPGTSVQSVLRRAVRAGLPRAEQGVFETWARMMEGEDESQALPIAGVPILAVILETLLSAGDAQRFNALLPALLSSKLDRREQRELLAGMFLSRGLLALAAQEWMAVCEQRPDARALLGLAQVARRNGMPEDAANFASGALELDPASTTARELLAHLAAPMPPGVAQEVVLDA
ncbi:MAG TPA: glycosyltransferase [Solirubrobacteraceae bacterium]|nr:glycosyltransferase [Solirubrobacteraceae bacterium]